MKYSIVVPLHNEELNVGPLWARISGALVRMDGAAEVFFVDDASTDTTAERVRVLPPGPAPLTLIRLVRRAGMSAAMQAGFDASSGETVITLDGDLQNDPDDIPAVAARLNGGFDLVCGWRRVRHDPSLKRLYSAGANFFRRLLVGEKVHDVGCNLRAMRRPLVNELRLSGGLHRYVSALAARLGYRVGEIEVRHHPRENGRTKFGFWRRLAQGTADMIRVAVLDPRELMARRSGHSGYEVREAVRV